VRAPQSRPKRRPETTTRMSSARSWTDEAALSGGFGDFAFAVVGEAHFWVVTFSPCAGPKPRYRCELALSGLHSGK
jgi:hypothetical protein